MSKRSGHLCKRILQKIILPQLRLCPQQARVHSSREGAEKLTFRIHSSENKCTFVSGEDSFHCHQFSTSIDGDSSSTIGLPSGDPSAGQARPKRAASLISLIILNAPSPLALGDLLRVSWEEKRPPGSIDSSSVLLVVC